jgi:hypothetical protein
MRDADVRCEWNNIDIFILSPQNRWAFIIENKVRSSQHSGQLAKYRNRITELFRAQDSSSEGAAMVDTSGIFLTLREEGPEDDEYASIGYDKICQFLNLYLAQEAYLLSSEVATFLKHYLEILEELTGMSKDRSQMENLARQLYREHKRVLDFIIEHGSGSDFALGVHRLFGENPQRGEIATIGGCNFVYSGLSKSSVSFLPARWREELDRTDSPWSGCENWWAGYPLIAWVEIAASGDGAKGQLKLIAEVGPLSNYHLRKSIIEALKTAAARAGLTRIHFQNGATEEKRLYSRFFRKNTSVVNDIHDSDEIERKLTELLISFQREFALVEGVIPQVLTQIDSHQNQQPARVPA